MTLMSTASDTVPELEHWVGDGVARRSGAPQSVVGCGHRFIRAPNVLELSRPRAFTCRPH
jgi:hypothetical protein